MKRLIIILICILLTPNIINAKDSCIVLEECFNSEGYQAYELENGRYFEIKNGVRRKLGQNLQSVKPVLKLIFKPTSKVYDSPSYVSGIVEDIPYNYFSSLDASSEFVYSLLNDGYLMKSYLASSQVILMELCKKDVIYRILVYENYLKVYLSEGGF